MGVGWGGGFWPPGWSKGVHFLLAPEGEPAISPYGAPNGQYQLGISPPPPVYGGSRWKWGLPTTRPGGGGIGQTPENRPLIGQMVFCPPLAPYTNFEEGSTNIDTNRSTKFDVYRASSDMTSNEFCLSLCSSVCVAGFLSGCRCSVLGH